MLVIFPFIEQFDWLPSIFKTYHFSKDKEYWVLRTKMQMPKKFCSFKSNDRVFGNWARRMFWRENLSRGFMTEKKTIYFVLSRFFVKKAVWLFEWKVKMVREKVKAKKTRHSPKQVRFVLRFRGSKWVFLRCHFFVVCIFYR